MQAAERAPGSVPMYLGRGVIVGEKQERVFWNDEDG